MQQQSAHPHTGSQTQRTGFPLSSLLLLTAGAYFIARAENLPQLHLAESITALPHGIYLINGIRIDDIAFSMPLTPFLSACLYGLPKWCENLVWPFFYILMGLLSFAAGRMLRSRLAGAITVLLMSYALTLSSVNHVFSGLLGPMLYAVSCSIVLLALLRRGDRQRTWQLELLTAVAIGISFMIKSPLALLPPFLTLWDIVSGKLKRGETNWKLLALLCLVPYAMLLPWIYMNYFQDNVFRLFEGGRADENLITGALGIVFTVEGAYPLANLPQNANFKLWALKTVLAHPLPYMEGVFKRIYSLIVLYPLASIGLTGALLRFRNDGRFRALGLLLFYFIGIHCLLSIQVAYFVPLWLPVLAACAALLDMGSPPATDSKTEKIIFTAVFSLLLTGYLAVSAYLLAYPSRVTLPSRIFNSEEAMPGANPILLVRASEFALYNGNIPHAYIKARSALLQRHSSLTAATYLRALSARGIDIEPPLRNRLLTRMDHNERLRYLSLLLLNALEKNKAEETERLLVRLRSEWKKWRFNFHKVTSEREEELYKQQQEALRVFEDEYIPGILNRLSPPQRHRFAAQLRALGVQSNQLLLMELGALTEDEGRKEELKTRIVQIAKVAQQEETMLMLLRLCIKNAFYKDTITYAQQLLKKGDSLQTRMYLADALLSDGQLEKAQAQLETIAEMHLDNADRMWLDDIKKKRDSRISHILKLIHDRSFAEGIPEARLFLKIQHNAPGTRLAISAALLLAENYDSAEQFLRELKPSDIQTSRDTENYQKQLSRLTVVKLSPPASEHDYKNLKKQAAKLLEWNPDNMEARLYFAEALIGLGEPQAAQQELEYAAQKKLPPQHWQKLLELTRLAQAKITERREQDMQKLEALFRARDFNAVSKLAAAILSETPDNSTAKIFLSEALLRQGQLDAAQEQLSTLSPKQLDQAQRRELQELSRQLETQRKMQNLSTNLQILDNSGSRTEDRAYANLRRQAADALMKTEGYRETGMLHMAQTLLKENKFDEARSYLSKLRSEPLSASQKTWADSMEKQIAEKLAKAALIEKTRRLQELQSASDQPKKLLPLAQQFAIDYPQETTGKLYFAAALIATGELAHAQTQLAELQRLPLGEQDRAWQQSLTEYLQRERNKCSLKNPKACIGKLKR